MYLDSAILVKLIVREADSAFYTDQVDGQTDAWSSELAITECWSALSRKEHEGRLDALGRRAAWKWFGAYLKDGGLQLQPVSEPVLRLANRMIERCQGRVTLRTLDAIHLASCEFCGAYPLVTNDRIMRQAADVFSIPLGPLAPK